MKTLNKSSRMFYAFIAVAMAFLSIFAYTPKTQAATLAQQKSSINEKINAAERELEKLEAEQASQNQIAQALQAQLADLTSKVYVIQQQQDGIDAKVTSLTNEIKSLEVQIDQTQIDLETMNANIETTVELFCERMRANYISGSSSMLEIFMQADDLSTFLNRVEMLKRVTDSDQELVDKLEAEISKAEKLKADLTQKKEDAQIKKTDLSAQKAELNASKAEYDSIIIDIEAKSLKVDKILYGVKSNIEELHDDIEGYKEDQASIVAAIKKAEEENRKNSSNSSPNSGGSSGSSGNAGSASGSISKSGWMWPVPTGSSYISSGYGYRRDPATGASKLHSGMDIAAPGGSKIVASKSGTVFYTKYQTTGYGYHLMINHGDGTYSLYGHCSSLAVSAGQKVSQGQVVAYVGQTGYATGNHCHFEIRDGSGNKYNPASYIHK